MSARFLLGWEEWLALPELGLPAIKAKVDTGARTSALHAFMIEPFGPADRPRVRFGVHPIPGRDDIEVICVADVADRREVASSNGERELRFVIRSTVEMGGRSWPIEITLANRETMAYRMLLGRQAIQEDMFVDATASFRQPRLSYKVYGATARPRESERGLAVALMTQRPDNASMRRLMRACEQRGHAVTVVDRTRLSLYIATKDPAIFLDGRPLAGLDAVIVRGGRTLSAFALAAVRQLEILGAYALNSADALARLGDALTVRQVLARAGIEVPEAAVSHADLIRQSRADSHVLADEHGMIGIGPMLRIAVIGGRSLAALERDMATSLDEPPEWRAVAGDAAALVPARQVAEGAARALGLGLAAVDIVTSRQGPVVVDITANASLAQFDRLCGTALAEAVIVHIEQVARARAGRV